jgi:hypothetical protein
MLAKKNTSNFLFLSLLSILPGCDGDWGLNRLSQSGEIHYGSGFTPYYNATRAVDYTRNLADMLEGLAPGDSLIAQARSAADDLEAAIKSMPYDPNAGGGQFLVRLTQALAAAGTQAGSVASHLEALTGKPGIPPDFPNSPEFRQTFSDVHGAP